MKPKNFAGRKRRRQQRAYFRHFENGVLKEQCHEVAELARWCVRRGLYVEQPTDIRIRMGSEARNKILRF